MGTFAYVCMYVYIYIFHSSFFDMIIYGEKIEQDISNFLDYHYIHYITFLRGFIVYSDFILRYFQFIFLFGDEE